jgi:hypothetical protein
MRKTSQHERRPLFKAVAALILVWMLAWSGYVISKHSRMTAEKVRQYQKSIDLSRLSAADRLRALKALAEKLNALSTEERQLWRLDLDWFQQLTDDEKAYFIDAFMPGEMQIALKMFEQWPKQRQQEEIDKALKELRNPNTRQLSGLKGTNGPLLTPELDQKIRKIGLNALYSKGSAQTKAELAPLLMEVQHQFESGQLSLSKF